MPILAHPGIQSHHRYRLEQLEHAGVQYAFYTRAQSEEPFLQANCQRFSSASIIKVPILLAWAALERQGELDRSELCDLDSQRQVRGAGLAWQLTARRLPYADVLLYMIALSDNLCTNLVIERIGLERLNRVMSVELGLTDTRAERKLMDYAARDRGLDNWVGVQDAVRFYELVRALPDDQRSWVERLLLANVDDALLMRNLPRDTVDFFHKTGSIPHVLHDWGYTRSREMFLFTQAVSDEPAVFGVFGALGELLKEETSTA